MTEVASAPRPAGGGAGARRISHWIGGRPAAGASGRCGPVWNPATGELQAEVELASVEEVDAAVAVARAAFPAWRALSLSRRAEVLFAFRELLHAAPRELAALITAEHGKVLADALGEVARGLEIVEFACGIPHLLKGGFSEQVATGVDVYSIRQPLGVVAGITPVQLPGDGADVDVPDGDRLRQRVRAQAEREGPVGVAARWRELWQEAGLPGRRLQRRAGRQGGGRRAARAPGRRRGQLRRLDADRPVHLRDRHRARQAGAGPRRREEPHGGAAGRRPRLGGRRGRVARPTARPASAAWRSRSWSRSAVARPARRRDRRAAAARSRSATAPTRLRDGPAGHRASTATRCAATSRRAPSQGATRGRRRPRRRRRRATASSSAPRCSTTSTPGDDRLHRRDLRPGAVRRARRTPTTRRWRSINDNPYGNGAAIFTRDGGAARQFQFEVEVGMVGINVPIPVPVAYYSFGGWKASLFGDTPHVRPRGRPLLHPRQGRHLPLARPRHLAVDLGFPQTR